MASSSCSQTTANLGSAFPPFLRIPLAAPLGVASVPKKFSDTSPLSSSILHVVIRLARPPHIPTWGLSVTLFPGGCLTVGAVNQNQVSALVRGYWAAPAKSDSGKFLRNGTHDDLKSTLSSSIETGHITRQIFLHRPCSCTPGTILPGDCILAINGIAMGRFQNLTQATGLLRSSFELELIILRHYVALERAWKFQQNPVPSSDPLLMNQAFLAAKAAYDIVRASMSPSQEPPKSVLCTPSRPQPTASTPASKASSYHPPSNPLFKDKMGNALPFDDETEIDPDDGNMASLFLARIDSTNLHSWLEKRKRKWRETYSVYQIDEELDVDRKSTLERHTCSVAVHFWTQHGFESFPHWLSTRLAQWKRSYSWSQEKRRRIEQDCEESVQLTMDNFSDWLRVRKNQWKVHRRRRQRQRRAERELGESCLQESADSSTPLKLTTRLCDELSSPTCVVKQLFCTSTEADLVVIDDLLEEQEREMQARRDRPPFDITSFLDPITGCPDDIVAHTVRFLDVKEHGKLLAMNRTTRLHLTKRDLVWRQLCPAHWSLPRRPRKPWHELYFTHLRLETELAQKRWDDLLSRASDILFKGDHLQSIEKLVSKAEREYTFDINYSSGVTCERNSVLNLAVIHRRHKVVRWLVEVKNADIESVDRGSFTPLMNAAWAGDKYLVRYFLQRGADRSKVGTCHYTKPLAPPDFEGFTAEGWALKRGHVEIADLISRGL